MTYIRSTPGPGAVAIAERKTAEAARREIAQEHRQIRALVEELETTSGLGALLPLLADLRGLLVTHFAREEAPDGLHRVVDGAAPRLSTSVQLLFDEHRQMLAALDGIEERGRACLEGPVAEVRRSVLELCRQLHEHEAAETELLAGALYEDIGGGD